MSTAVTQYDDRDASLFHYGPLYYGVLREEDESGGVRPCPPIDYTDPGYYPWHIRMSLTAVGRSEDYINFMIQRSTGPRIVPVTGDSSDEYHTLLFKMNISPRDHGRYDRMLINLYQGFLRSIVSETVLSMVVTLPIMFSLSTIGAAFIGGPFYRYKIIILNDEGYFYYTHGNESPSNEAEDDEEEEDID